MFRPRIFVTVLVVLGAALLVAGASADAAIPRGPHLVVEQAKAEPDLLLIGPNDESRYPIVIQGEGSIGNSTRPIWSPDGKELAFFVPWIDNPTYNVIRADGTDFREFPNPGEHPGEPAWDPIGDALVFPVETWGETESQTENVLWSISANGSASHQIGPSRHHTFIQPTSFAPDGTGVGKVWDSAGGHLVTFEPQTGVTHRLLPASLRFNEYPVVSPDGTEVAYVHERHGGRAPGSDLMLVPISGGKPKRIARLPGWSRWPSWDPSGSRIAFVEGNTVMEINADGTCRTKVYSPPGRGTVSGAAWQPGRGRGVGPLSC